MALLLHAEECPWPSALSQQCVADFARLSTLYTPLDAFGRPLFFFAPLHHGFIPSSPSPTSDPFYQGEGYGSGRFQIQPKHRREGKGREGTHGLHCLPSHGPLIDLVGREVLDPSPRSTPGADQGSSRPLVEPCVVSTLSGRPPLRKQPSTRQDYLLNSRSMETASLQGIATIVCHSGETYGVQWAVSVTAQFQQTLTIPSGHS